MKSFFCASIVLALAGGAAAAPVLRFDSAFRTTSMSYAGGATPLVGSGIQFGTVTGTDTPLNSGVTLTIANGALNFETGNLTGFEFQSQHAGNWDFGGGGSIRLSGNAGDASGTLLDGDFAGAVVSGETGSSFKTLSSTYAGTVNSQLLAFYGLSPDTVQGTLSGAFTAGGGPGSPFVSDNVIRLEIVAAPAPVPEPATLLLLGAGVIGLGIVRRRRRTA